MTFDRWTALAIAIVFAGCLQADLVPCGDNLCPAGTTCVVGELCASPDQLAACAGVADGTPCTQRLGVGYCDRGVCVAAACGNGIVDRNEVCDGDFGVDVASGQRCSDDCKRIEVCGNGVLDPGEECDDGYNVAAAGCDACRLATWHATAVIGGDLAATTVPLTLPIGMAADRHGNFYIADFYDHRIRRVDATGVITTVAGTSIRGFGGDHGPATSAQLHAPEAVAIDGLGNLFIADGGNHRIRRVDTDGVITTVAGTGTAGYSGDGAAAINAKLNRPVSIAVDGLGNLFISDGGNHRIRKVDTNGVITTVAGIGTAGFSGDGGPATSASLADPYGVVSDGAGTLFIADTSNFRIRKVDPAGIIATVAGTGVDGTSGDGGPATAAQISFVGGLAIDGVGDLYLSDMWNNRIRRVSASGVITAIAGDGTRGFGGDSGPATSAILADPYGLAVGQLGELYIADSFNLRVRRVDPNGIVTTVAGSGVSGVVGDGGAATSATMGTPEGVTLDSANNIIVADRNGRIRKIATSGVITTIAGSDRVGSSGDGGPATSAAIFDPNGVAFDSLGNMYIADPMDHCIRKVDSAGIITTFAGTGVAGYTGDGGPAASARLDHPTSVAVDGANNLYIADPLSHCVRRVSANGIITTFAGTGTAGYNGDNRAATNARLSGPMGVAVDSAGYVFIADTDNHRIRRVDLAGNITTIAGDGVLGYSGDAGPATAARLAAPPYVAADSAGRLLIADVGNLRVRAIDLAGTITTVAGTGGTGFAGDGGLATAAAVRPGGVTFDGAGGFYVVDTIGNCIRHVDATGTITSIAGRIDPVGMGPGAKPLLSDPRALAIGAPFTFVAGGSSGTVQAARTGRAWLDVVAGRYPQDVPTGSLARFRDQNVGTVSGVAYDAAAGIIYITESSSNRLHAIQIVDVNDAATWTITALNTTTTGGFANGPLASAQFRNPTGLYLDEAAHQLYVADTGNHTIRAIDLSSGLAGATVRTIAGTPETLGYFGDGGAATSALLYEPQAITRCPNGDLFIADTSNHRVRRVAAATGVITSVLGAGAAASSGEGAPAAAFAVNAPRGLACDASGNVFATSTTTVRLLPADPAGVVDGTGRALTIYGLPPRDAFPASVTKCLTGVAVVDTMTADVVDSCTGLLVELRLGPP